jgi:hypothetical protein
VWAANPDRYPAHSDVDRAATEDVRDRARDARDEGIMKASYGMHSGTSDSSATILITGADPHARFPQRERRFLCYAAGVDKGAGLAPVTWDEASGREPGASFLEADGTGFWLPLASVPIIARGDRDRLHP